MPVTQTRSASAGHAGEDVKMIYRFSKSHTDGDASQRELLGGKGANLAEMSTLKLPVPPGFTITTRICAEYYENGQKLPDGLMAEVRRNVAELERETTSDSTTGPACLWASPPATRASPTTPTGASSTCSATSSWA